MPGVASDSDCEGSSAPAFPADERTLTRRYLEAGDLLIVHEPTEITTVLGPCVALTLWHRPTGIGAICHAMLPEQPVSAQFPEAPRHRWKYAAQAVPAMLVYFREQGIRVAALEAKLFGGANLLGLAAGEGGRRIGEANVLCVRQLLDQYGLKLSATDVGGPVGRKVIFNTLTGRVRVKRMIPRQSRL